jgi:hypothetical protein
MAIFFRRNRFTLLETRRLDLTRIWERFEDICDFVKSNPALEEQMRNTSTVAQLMLLQPFDRHGATGKLLAVVNTHLFSHPMSPHVRMLQTAIIVREVARLHPDTPLVYCGDFNADANSGAYSLLSQGSVSEQHFEWTEGHTGLGLLGSGTKAEREENWHAVVEPNDTQAIRALFTSVTAKSGSDADGDMLARAWAQVKKESTTTAAEELPAELVAAMDERLAGTKDAPASWPYSRLFGLGVAIKGIAPASCAAIFRRMARAVGSLGGGDAARLVEAMAQVHHELPRGATIPRRPDDSGKPAALCLSHSLKLESALRDMPVSYCAGKPPSPCVVDHMFYSQALLEPNAAPYPQFTMDDVKGGLPNACMPSDHCALLCDFAWRSDEQEDKTA